MDIDKSDWTNTFDLVKDFMCEEELQFFFNDYTKAQEYIKKIEYFILDYFNKDFDINPFDEPFVVSASARKHTNPNLHFCFLYWRKSEYYKNYFNKVFTLYYPILQAEFLAHTLKDSKQQSKKIHKI